MLCVTEYQETKEIDTKDNETLQKYLLNFWKID